MNRPITTLAAALAAALLLAGCGGTGSSGSADGSTAARDHNDDDVTFAQQMIPHHEQAVQMSRMAARAATSPEVKALAAKIEAAQGPEIETMQGWLDHWGESDDSDDSGGHHMGDDSGGMGGSDHMDGDDMPGMMSDAELSRLQGSRGAAFDSMFLTMMIAHHEGAIEMARTEQRRGKNADAVALAKKIEADQTAEIAEMKRMLSGN